MLNAVLFDVDGVLVDSQRAEEAFFRSLFLAGGYPEPSQGDIDSCCHLALRDAIRCLLGTGDAHEIDRLWVMGHDPSLYPMELLRFPAKVVSVVGGLSSRFRLGIVTNRLKHDISEVLRLAAIEPYFSVVVGFGDFTHPKPHPEPLLIGARLLDVEPRQAVYVGDRATDVKAAIAAGMKCICLSRLPQPGADVTVADFEDICSAVSELEAQLNGS